MIYKFAAADMDGTLLNDKNEITLIHHRNNPAGSRAGTDFLRFAPGAHSGSGALSETAGDSGPYPQWG